MAMSFSGAVKAQLVDGTGEPVDADNPLPIGDGAITPASGTAAVVTTGGTAVTLVTGPITGGWITNPPNTASQGVTAENLYVDMVGVPGSTDAVANGTTTILTPGATFYLPPLVAGVLVRGNAATSGHKVTVVTW